MKIGYAKREITPKVGVMLAGNGDFRSEAVHDPLHAHALVIEDQGQRVALVSCDLLGTERELTENVVRLLGQCSQAAFSQVLISGTHTHNGPVTRFAKAAQLKHRDETYLRSLENRITEAIVEAASKLREATLRYGRGVANENFHRRLITPDGVAHFYNPATLQENPALEALTGGPTDPELAALQFLDPSGQPLLTLVQYAAHPLTVGLYANVISRDYCGRLVDLLEEAYSCPAMFFLGACGDLHCKGLFAGFERMEAMARSLAGEVQRVLNTEGLPQAPGRLRIASRRIRLEVDPARVETGGWNRAHFGDFCEMELVALSLGPVWFLSIPGELCSQPGMEIKANLPFAQTWFLYNGNGYLGYLLHRRGYVEGGYEYDTTCLKPSACPLVVQTAIALGNELA